MEGSTVGHVELCVTWGIIIFGCDTLLALLGFPSKLVLGLVVCVFTNFTYAGATVLHEAARGGCRNIVRYMLDHGVCVNARDVHGVTPLLSAAYGGHCEVLELLLERRADMAAVDSEGQSALHVCALKHDGGVQLLLDRGFDSNVRTRRGETALHSAAFSIASATSTRLLLAAGADVNARCAAGYTSLQTAAYGVGRIHYAALVPLIAAGAVLHTFNNITRTWIVS